MEIQETIKPFYEQSFLLMKPDAILMDCWEDALGAIAEEGLHITGIEFIDITEEQVREMYPKRMNDELTETLIAYLTGGQSAVMLVEGFDAINAIRRIKGQPHTDGLRRKYAHNFIHNCFHCPADKEEYERDLNIIFNGSYETKRD